jgi:alkylated DNA repair dioxygenase AlkB
MSLFDDTLLFTTPKPRTVRFDLPDAELTLYEGFFSKNEADRLYTSLLQTTEWRQEPITVYGKTYPTPRLTAWYGDPAASYTFSGSKWEPYSWSEYLLFVKGKVEKTTGAAFNSVLLNLYRNGNDGVVMAGPMQHFWEHQVPKTAKPIHPRINLTFRFVFAPS